MARHTDVVKQRLRYQPDRTRPSAGPATDSPAVSQTDTQLAGPPGRREAARIHFQQQYQCRRSRLAGRLSDPLFRIREHADTGRPGAPALVGRAARMLGAPFVLFVLMALVAARPAFAKYDVDIEAPRSVRSLLKDHLNLSRFAKRDDVSDEQFEFLVTATPQEVRDLVATDGYFTPVVRTDVKTVDDRKTVTVSVDPGPRTMVASVSP